MANLSSSARRLRRTERQRSSDLLLTMIAGIGLFVLVLALVTFLVRAY